MYTESSTRRQRAYKNEARRDFKKLKQRFFHDPDGWEKISDELNQKLKNNKKSRL